MGRWTIKSISLPIELVELAESKAEEEGISFSELVRRALVQYLKGAPSGKMSTVVAGKMIKSFIWKTRAMIKANLLEQAMANKCSAQSVKAILDELMDCLDHVGMTHFTEEEAQRLKDLIIRAEKYMGVLDAWIPE